MARAHRDPTAEKAIAKVYKEAKASRKRQVVQEFPEIFDDLNDHATRWVAFRAHALAGDNVWAIRLEHLEQARTEYGAKE